MDNLVQIMSQTYVVSSQAGWRKLLKKLNCYNTNYYHYEVIQCTTNREAYELWASSYNNKTYAKPLQYPIKYPCIASFQDETFEHCHYYISIKYIDKELRDTLIKEPYSDTDIDNVDWIKQFNNNE